LEFIEFPSIRLVTFAWPGSFCPVPSRALLLAAFSPNDKLSFLTNHHFFELNVIKLQKFALFAYFAQFLDPVYFSKVSNETS